MKLLVFISTLTLCNCTIIENGEVGVKKSFGKISDQPEHQGMLLSIPIVQEIERWNTKLQEIQERANVPSSEGLIVGLDISLLYKVEADKAPTIRKTIGRYYKEKLIQPYLRSEIRDAVSGSEVKEIFSEMGRKRIADKVLLQLRATLEKRGLKIVDVLLRDIKLPQKFKDSIELKLAAEQKAEQKHFEKIQAGIDAQIEVVRAKGASESQKILTSTLSDKYLQYKWLTTLEGNNNVIYVATESNMPLMKNVGKSSHK
jgi:prohibitin 1